jgi:hypothetical protein
MVVAAEAQDYGDDRTPAESDQLKESVNEHRQSGQISRIFNERKREEERGHDGRNNSNSVAQPKRDDPILADQQVLQKSPREHSAHELGSPTD